MVALAITAVAGFGGLAYYRLLVRNQPIAATSSAGPSQRRSAEDSATSRPPEPPAEARSPLAEPHSGAGTDRAWQKDWVQFGRAITDFLKKPNADWSETDAIFGDEEVAWTGRIEKIERGDGRKEAGTVQLEMPNLAIQITDTYIYERRVLVLYPEPDEWDSWKTAKVGDTVVFRTHIRREHRAIAGMALPGTITACTLRGNMLMTSASVSGFVDAVKQMDSNKTKVMLYFGVDGGKLLARK